MTFKFCVGDHAIVDAAKDKHYGGRPVQVESVINDFSPPGYHVMFLDTSPHIKETTAFWESWLIPAEATCSPIKESDLNAILENV